MSQNILTIYFFCAIIVSADKTMFRKGVKTMSTIRKSGRIIINREQFIDEDTPVTKNSLSCFFGLKLKELSKKLGKKISKKDVADMVGISHELFRKMINREKTTKKRDCIIAVCAALRLDTFDTNLALKHNDWMEPLDDYNIRDEFIMNILDNLSDNPKTADDNMKIIPYINAALVANGFSELDIITHRNTDKGRDYPFNPVRKHFQCTIGGVTRYTDPFWFMDLLYDVDNFYTMRTSMEFEGNGKRIELTVGYKEPHDSFGENCFVSCLRKKIAPPEKKYTVYTYPDEEHDSEIKEFDDISETGIFRKSFLELEKTETAEKRKFYSTINDSRNYEKRIAAKVIGNRLHIFYEEYNYYLPELGEYCLMDYCDGEFTLSVSDCSRFMYMYLPEEKYRKIYGESNFTVTEEYSSLSDIEDSAYVVTEIGPYESYRETEILELRKMTYKKMKAGITSVIKKMKAGTAHICNPDVLSELDENFIFDYLGMDASVTARICAAENVGKKAEIKLSNGMKTELSVSDLLKGFELGLKSLDEAGHFLLKNGTLDIKEILEKH